MTISPTPTEIKKEKGKIVTCLLKQIVIGSQRGQTKWMAEKTEVE